MPSAIFPNRHVPPCGKLALKRREFAQLLAIAGATITGHSPDQTLVAFTRISRKPGESGQVRFVIHHEDRVRLKRLFLGGP